MRGRSGLLMRRAAYWAPAVVAAALLVGGIAALWIHSQPARAGVRSGQPASPVTGSWARLADTPDLFAQTLLLLSSGKVLMPLSGYYSGAIANIYNPASNTWSTTSSFTQDIGQQAVLLRNGTALFTGDFITNAAGTEIYDPVHDSWKVGGSLTTGRTGEALITLQDGRVLAAGGYGGSANYGVLSSAEIYDPATNHWSTVASMAHSRIDPTVVLLSDGRVFVVGGWKYSAANVHGFTIRPGADGNDSKATVGASVHGLNLAPGVPLCGTAGCPVAVPSAEVYNPATNTWTSAGSLPEPDGRSAFTATLLPTGKVLVAGGLVGGNGGLVPALTNLLYNPTTNSWSQAATMNHQRGAHAASLLPTGRLLVAGGVDGMNGASTELYDASANTWTLAPDMPIFHIGAGAVTLKDGRVMVNGGGATYGGATAYPTVPSFQAPSPQGGGPRAEVDAFSTVPGLPGSVHASAGNGSAKVTWTAATPDGRPISGYTVTASPGGKQAKVGGTATSASVSGLTNGTRYSFTVTATNAFGDSPASAPSNAVTPSVPPTPTPPPGGSGGNGSGGGPTGQTGATPTATTAPSATDTPVPQTSVSNPPPGPPNNANRSTGGSPPLVLLGMLVLLILLLGAGAVFVFARRGTRT